MSSFSLKIVACITMFIDHTGAVYDIDFFRIIGRIAFPIFAFLVAQSCKYTSNRKKYLLRLFTFALISEIPFNIMVNLNAYNPKLVLFDPAHQNIFFTLFLGALLIHLFEIFIKVINDKPMSKKILYGILYATIFQFIAMSSIYLNTDYQLMGVSLIFMLYIIKKPIYPIVIFSLIAYPFWINFNLFMFMLCFGALVSFMFIDFYNGEKGRNAKWFFYSFYPIHILVIVSSVFILQKF